MDPNSIEDWLSSNNLAEYADCFRSNHITLETLATLTDAEIKECGVTSLGHRKLIMRLIRQQPDNAVTITPSAPTAREPAPEPAKASPIAVAPPATPRHKPATVPPATPVVSPPPTALQEIPVAAAEKERTRRRNLWQRILASKVLMISILVHVLFGVVATYLIVQSIEAKRKLTFQGGPSSPNPSTRALEHQINMTRRQQTMSAPAQAKRITTTGLAKITLPDMPSLPAADTVTPDRMAGMGGVGMGFGMSGGGGGGGGGGRGVNLFGMHEPGLGLAGTFYDFRTQPDGSSPVGGMNLEAYHKFLHDLDQNGWRINRPHYTSPTKLYATVFYIPTQLSPNAGAAFQSRTHPDGLWVVRYKGRVVAPESGTFRFVGFSDNLLYVRWNGRMVLDASDLWYTHRPREQAGPGVGIPNSVDPTHIMPLYYGDWFDTRAGDIIDIEVMGGDEGGLFEWGLFIQKRGVEFTRDPGPYNSPHLPLFATAPFSREDKARLRPYVVSDECFNGLVWKALPTSSLQEMDDDSDGGQ